MEPPSGRSRSEVRHALLEVHPSDDPLCIDDDVPNLSAMRATLTMAIRMPIRVPLRSLHSTTRHQYYRSATQVRTGVPDPIHKLSTTSKELISSKVRMLSCTGLNFAIKHETWPSCTRDRG